MPKCILEKKVHTHTQGDKTTQQSRSQTYCHIILLFTALNLSDVLSVGVQDAIRRLRPLNPVSVSVSSRTDSGVHALSNSAHFDLQRKNDKPPFTEDILVHALNSHLKTEQIR